MTPSRYWTLLTPYVTLVGLYTNVVNGGKLDDDQVTWLQNQLKNHKEKENESDEYLPLILTMHNPAISFDALHPGSQYMENILNDAINKSKRVPDMVIGGHTHNYQRFTRTIQQERTTQQEPPRQTPYIVAGGGGFWNLTAVADANGKPLPTPLLFNITPPKPPHPDSPFEIETRLEKYVDDQYGYLRLTVDNENKNKKITGDYIAVSSPKESWQPYIKTDEIFLKDSFTLDLENHTVTTNPMPPSG